jgi:hypothetical protein
MAKRVNGGFADDATLDVVLLAGVGIAAYFLVVKPLLGLSGSDPAITAQAQLPGTQNPFNYQFQPFVDFYNENAPTITAPVSGDFWQNMVNTVTLSVPAQTISNPTIQQYFQSLYPNIPSTSTWGYLNTEDLSQRAQILYNALSVSALNPLSTSDQTGGLSALSGLSNQLQVAFIANYFWWNYGVDLLTFLNGSLVKAGLSSANLVQIINTVNSLPVNP